MSEDRSIVDRIVPTAQFIQGVKKLRKDHKTDVLDKLTSVIDDLKHFRITSGLHNHPVGNGINDIHIASDIILLYRYKGNILLLELELNNITDHKNLSAKINGADKLLRKKGIEATSDMQALDDIITSEAFEPSQSDNRTDIITATPFYKNYIAKNPSIISKEDLDKIVASGLYDIIDFNTPYPASDYELSEFKVINPNKVSLTFETSFIAQDLDDYTEAGSIDAAAYGLKRFVNDTELDPHITNIELIDDNFDTMALIFTADEDFSNPGKYLFELSAGCMNGSIFDQDGPHGENYAKYDSDIEVDITADISREN